MELPFLIGLARVDLTQKVKCEQRFEGSEGA